MHREARHGAMWTDGYSRVMCARSTSDPNAMHNFRAEVERARRHREKVMMDEQKAKAKLAEMAKIKYATTPKVVVVKPMEPIISVPIQKEEPMKVEKRKVKRSYHKFDIEDRRKIWGYIMTMANEGKNNIQMSHVLGLLGYNMPDGSRIKPNYINQTLANIKNFEGKRQKGFQPHPIPLPPLPPQKKLEVTPPRGWEAISNEHWTKPAVINVPAPIEAPKPLPPPRIEPKQDELRIPEAVVSILKGPFPDEKKVKVMLLWINDQYDKLPESFLNILTDAAMTPKLKIQILMELA